MCMLPKAAEKERKKAEAAAKAKALEELKKIPPSEMFRPDNILRFESFKSDPKYSKFDDKVSILLKPVIAHCNHMLYIVEVL